VTKPILAQSSESSRSSASLEVLGGSLLAKPGCGSYEYEKNQFGVIEAHRIIRRWVFLPDLSEHYSRETAPALRKRKADALEPTWNKRVLEWQ
jgi:hypothetical protein